MARHGDRKAAAPPNVHLILGHLHPTLMFRDSAGARHRMPLFLVNSRATILPAFSPYSAGFDVLGGLPSDLLELFGEEPIKGFVISGQKVAAIRSHAFAPKNV